MPIITYTIQKNVCKTIKKRQCWYYEYEQFLVDVSDKVAAFMARDDKREQRYQWKIKKQIQDAKIHTLFSLDEIKSDSESSEEYLVANITEDTVNPENRNPLSILIEREDNERLDYFYSKVMTSKRYETFKLHEQGYNKTEIAELLNIDESSARERLEIALITAVEFYIVHSNIDILQGLHDFIFNDLQGKISETKYSKLVGTAFRQLIYLLKPGQRKMIEYIINGEHKNEIKKYLDSSEQTPENPS